MTLLACGTCGVSKPPEDFYGIYTSRCKGCAIAAGSERVRQLRQEAMAFLGGACACCGVTAAPFLEFDHVNNDGRVDRGESGRGRRPGIMYRQILRGEYPFAMQLMCRNCNRCKSEPGAVCDVHRESKP